MLAARETLCELQQSELLEEGGHLLSSPGPLTSHF